MKRYFVLTVVGCLFLFLFACSQSEQKDDVTIYVGNMLSVHPTDVVVDNTIEYDAIIKKIPSKVVDSKDTLHFYHINEKVTESQFVVSDHGSHSTLEVSAKSESDSVFRHYVKETIRYSPGVYVSDNKQYVAEVTSDSISLFSLLPNSPFRQIKRKYLSLSNFTRQQLTPTDKFVRKPIGNTHFTIECNDNSLHFVNEKYEYRFVNKNSSCQLYQLKPERFTIEMKKK